MTRRRLLLRRLALPLGFATVLGVAVGLFARALPVGFLSDEFYLPLLLSGDDVDWTRVLRDCVEPWLGVPGSSNYRPGISLHYAIDLTLFGVDARGFHLGNVLLHGLNAGLVFALSRLLLPDVSPWAPTLAGLLFAVHPVAPEAVTWISGRVDTTTALPYLLGLVLAARAARLARAGTPATGTWLLATLAGAAALVCKESAITFAVSLVLVEALARRGAPTWRSIVAGTALTTGYLAARILALGGLGTDAGEATVAAALVRTLPGKLAALFWPETWHGAPAWLTWAFLAVFGVLPLLAALTMRATRRLAPLLLCWAVLLLLPAYPVPILGGYGGTRVLYLSAVPLGLLFGAALGTRRMVGAGGLVRLVIAVCLLGCGARLCDARNRVFVRAGETVRATQAAVAALAPARSGRALFLVDLIREIERVHCFRYDNAYLAFRRPFARADEPVFVGSNMAIEYVRHDGQADASGLWVARRAGMQCGVFDEALGRYEELRGGNLAELPLLTGTFAAPGAQLREDGWHVPPSTQDVVFDWQPQAIESTAWEAARMRLVDPGGSVRPVLSWLPASYRGTAIEQAPLFRQAFLPWHKVEREALLVAPIGTLLGWVGQYRYREPLCLRLTIPPRGHEVVVADLRLLARLPELPVVIGAAGIAPRGGTWRIPLERPIDGPLRLVLVTPMKVADQWLPDGARDHVDLEPAVAGALDLMRRLAPGTRIWCCLDRVAENERPDSTLERSAGFSFVLR